MSAELRLEASVQGSDKPGGGWGASGIRGLQQEGWWSDIRQDFPRTTEGKVWVVLETVLCSSPCTHILGEYWSHLDPNPCSLTEAFLIRLWGVTSTPSPPG